MSGLVRHHGDRNAVIAVEVDEKAHDVLRTLGIEVSGGLVGEEKQWTGDDGARDGDTLLLAAGELRREVMLAARHPDAAKRLQRQLPLFPEACPAIDQRQLDILERAALLKEVIALEDEADELPAQERALLAR